MAKRNSKKYPFLLMVRYADWPEGQYRILASEPFENTRAAMTKKDETFKANGISVTDVLRNHGGMTIAVAQMTEIHKVKPSVGYTTEELDPMESAPVETPVSGGAPAASAVNIPPEAATPPQETPEAPEVPETPPAPEAPPEPPPAPAAPPPPPPSSDDGAPPAPTTAEAPPDMGDETTSDPWDNFGGGDPIEEAPPSNDVQQPPPAPPEAPPSSASDVLV